MIIVPGYEISREIFTGPNKVLAKAVRTVDSAIVILKIVSFSSSDEAAFKETEHEFSVGSDVCFGYVLEYLQKIRFENHLIIEFADFEGIVLSTYLEMEKLSVGEKLDLAFSLIRVLEEIHYTGLVHSDIRPEHFLINPVTREIKLTDLSLAFWANDKSKPGYADYNSRRVLHYISPEQTGRMDIGEDYRSDYYALGVLFYRICTGQLPFDHNDANELVHAHMARQPIPPIDLDSEIPLMVSELIQKLLEKKPDSRYQTTRGIRQDLRACRDFCTTQKDDSFQAGKNDTPGRFEIPARLYGRKEEAAFILEAYERVSVQNEIVLVYGNSGIGKSSLAAEVQHRLSCMGALFVTGKFDQFVENIPFEAVIKAFSELIGKISNGDKEELIKWKKDILQAVGTYGQIIIEVIPQLELIIGRQPEVQILAPAESQTRFVHVFSNFINVFTKEEHPLVIFLDDLQWADASSLRFLGRVLRSVGGKYLLLMGSYRDNELHKTHPLAVTIQQMEEAGINFRQVGLLPLSTEEVAELIADTFSCPLRASTLLAEPIFSKTLGNPFFIGETLRSLYTDKLIYFDGDNNRWSWDLQSVADYADSGSSQDLLTGKINRLPAHTKQALVCAACIGKEFNIEILSALNDKTPQETIEDLRQAITENLVLVSVDKMAATQEKLFSKSRYAFVHDQVQQAAYALMGEEQKRSLHLDIGYFMLERLSSTQVDNRLFEIVNHLNAGHDQTRQSDEKFRIAALNLSAGKKAKVSTAYSVSLEYFKTGLRLVDETDWQSHPDLLQSLHTECAESQYLTGNLPACQQLVQTLLDHARSREEKINAHQLHIQSMIFHKKSDEAIQLSLFVLAESGIRFPAKPQTWHVLGSYIQTKWLLRGKQIEDLGNLPAMQDPEILAAMRILQNITAIAFVRIPILYPLMVLKMLTLSLKYGNAPESALTYITYGAIVNAIEIKNQACYRYGKVGLKLLDHIDSMAIRERSNLVFNIVSRPSGEHISNSLEALKRSFMVGIELGDIEYCTYASSSYSFFLLLSGKNLNWVKDEMIRFNHLPRPISIDNRSNENEPLIQIVSNILGENEDPVLLTGAYFEEGAAFSKIMGLSDQTRIFACFLYKMILCYLTGEYEKGYENTGHALNNMANVKGLLFQPLFCYYHSLLGFAMARKYPSKGLYQKAGMKYKQKLKKWADQVPVNFMHRYYLLEAEALRNAEMTETALAFYDKAISMARDNHYSQDEALANELCGDYWLEKGQERLGHVYIQSALEAYKKWGGVIKVKQLKAKHGELATAPAEFSENGRVTGVPGQNIASTLDIATLMKASTAISSEVVFARLMEKLMQFAIENAGAQDGFFILDWGGKLCIEAWQSVSDSKSEIRQLPLAGSGLIPETIIEHVFRTKSDVILHDAKADEQFKNDPLVVRNDVRSVMCIPAMNQGKLVGVLYLENNLTTGAFTRERTELLKLLSGQIAVSIENSILYENLEQKVAIRTTEIQVQKEEIERQKLLVEEKSKFKEQFFANMSHEIRTPMTAIIGMSELIFDTPLSPKQLEYAKGIRYSSENLLAIINDILDYSKIEAGKFSFVQKPFHIRDRMNRLGYILKVIAEEKGIALDIAVVDDVSGQLIGDPLRLHQILLNLASNAVKFTDHGSVQIHVSRLSGDHETEELLFKVTDTGIGIAEEKLQYIFETFTRIDEDLNSKQTGTGLGLFIAKRLVEEQGGEMKVTSQLKAGTEFSFNLSFEICETDEDTDRAGDEILLTGVRILLVEDNLFNQVVAEETLKKMIPDVQVTIADNGQIAVEKYETGTFDIILMDVKMPVMDGYKATQAIRATEKDVRIPILAFTSNANPAEAQKCRAAGMDDYITKPIEAKRLKAKIRKLLDQKILLTKTL
ncbi:MAG: AAA family ATPase [Dyadobacter sp.]|uniref:AAA family ATPase n=1 Tax=Dyadobacter sp. TaxID=1914288 RepID=UPI0032634248